MEVCCDVESDGSLSAGKLPPGFRFHPTDEEIIVQYLFKKVLDPRFATRAIGEVDLNKCEPWDLPKQAKTGEKEWYFFCQKDRKYPTGMRTNRATESGYWKATGKDKDIIYKDKKCVVGMKKTLVFYKGRAPKGQKTDWVIHEYRLDPKFSSQDFSRPAKDEWVVCKVFNKSLGIKRLNLGVEELSRMDTLKDHLSDRPTLPLGLGFRSNFAAKEDKFNDIISSRLALSNHRLQILQHDQKMCNIRSPFSCHNNPMKNPNFCPQIVLPNSVFPYQSSPSLGCRPQVDFTSSCHADLAFKGDDLASLMGPFSSNNSVLSHSQDTLHNNSEISNEINSVHTTEYIENETIFDEELEGLAYSPCISDLGLLWSY